MPNVVSSIDSFNFPRTRGEIVVTLSQQLTCLPMPPLNKLKSGAFTLEFKRKLPQNAGKRKERR